MAPAIAKIDAGARKVRFELPSPLRAPLLGLAWVMLNAALVWLATTTGSPSLCAMAAGAIDGAVISVIVVAKANDKFQGAATGLISGVTLDSFAAEPSRSIVSRVTHAVHGIVDGVAMAEPTLVSEKAHQAIETAAIEAIWLAIIVVLAALIIRWTLDSTTPPCDPGPQPEALAIPLSAGRMRR